MAMIRGRKLTVPKTNVDVEMQEETVNGKPKKPLARLKEQRRLTIGYSKTPEKILEPIPDPDPFYEGQGTFLVLNKNRVIFRLSEKKSLFLFGQKSKVRRLFINILVNQWFNGIVIVTILVNCLVMMINGNEKPEWSEKYVEHVFTAIYTIEAIVKIIGRGFILHSFSYLRDAWNWLDFIVILAAYVLIIVGQMTTGESNTGLNSLTFLRAIRVLRVFKTVSVIPGLRMIVSALVASTKALKDAMLLSLLGFSMFSLIGIQLFRGTLQHKCVLLPPWMLPTPKECAMQRNISQLNSCTFESLYKERIIDNFGLIAFNEMNYLNALWERTLQNSTNLTRSSDGEMHPNFTLHARLNSDFYHIRSHNNKDNTTMDNLTCVVSNPNVSLDSAIHPRDFRPPFNSSGYEFNWDVWIDDSQHYLRNDHVFKLCGNISDALKCPHFSTCIRAGQNPNFGYTSFDNFLFAFLSVFRLSLQDNWEELYLQVLETNGLLSWFFFLAMIFLGSYYLVNLILAVVASSYEEQRKSVENSLEEEKRELLKEKEVMKKRRNATRTISEVRNTSIQMQENKLQDCCCSCFYQFKDVVLLWSCCIGNSFICRIRDKLRDFFMNSTSELITVLLVVLNTMFMAMEREPKTESFNNFLVISNMVFTVLFAIEMALKIFALSPYNYFTVTWNIFDFVVVTLSLFELFLSDKVTDGISILRTFRLIRLVRILKLAKSWPTLSKLMRMIADSLSKIGYLTLVLLIVLVIFALAGMQTVGSLFYMDINQGIPLRWHMNDFPHAFLVVFRVQCGEWIQSMWRCMNSVTEKDTLTLVPVCVFIFLGVVFVGNLVVLNLFLALLLNSFSSDALNSNDGKKSSIKHMFSSLKSTSKKYMQILAIPKFRRGIWRKRKISPSNMDETIGNSTTENKSSRLCKLNGVKNNSILKTGSKYNIQLNNNKKTIWSTFQPSMDDIREETEAQIKNEMNSSSEYGSMESITEEPSSFDNLSGNIRTHSNKYEFNGNKMQIVTQSNSNKTPACSKSKPTIYASIRKLLHIKNVGSKFRGVMSTIVNHAIFESFIIFVILLSSIALVFDDIHLPQKPKLKLILTIFDRIFTGIFFFEMIMKWIGLGLKKYFTNGWCLLDFFIVVVSLVSLGLEISALYGSKGNNSDLSSLRVLRSLRAFRPLRAMSRFHGIKVVTDALFRSIPSIFNVFVICLVFWLIFAIMGVNLFAGKMAACRWRENNAKVWHPQDFIKTILCGCKVWLRIVTGSISGWPKLRTFYDPTPIDVVDRNSCLCLANLTGGKVHWTNLLINFDNVAISYISLLQVATFKGWMPIMFAAVDSPGEIGQQPILDNNILNYFFFVAFIIFGAFFTLNLFISVVIDNFKQQKKKFEMAGTELFLTESQRKLYSTMKKLKAKLPKQLFPIPKAPWREKLYLFVTGNIFELAVLVVTILNLVTMAIEYDGMPTHQKQALFWINMLFLASFVVEIFLRIVAMGKTYFYVPWNVFDFLIIVISVLINAITIGLERGDATQANVSPWVPLLRMVRVFRILRVARIASGIRTLLFALLLSAPALINVGSLLVLFMFIYSIFGMSQFSHVEKKGAINDILNFETFPNTFLLLFQMSTSAGWDGFMEPTLYVDGPDAECNSGLNGEKRTCMSTSFVGYFYFVSYLIVTFVIITNMYIAIILENFDLATLDNEEALTADDFEHFFDVWQRFDKNGNGKLTVEQLSDLLHVIDKPLRIKQPNKLQIASMRIPMTECYELHIVDVATALVKKILGEKEFTKEMEEELKSSYYAKSNRAKQYDNGKRVTTTYEYINTYPFLNLAHGPVFQPSAGLEDDSSVGESSDAELVQVTEKSALVPSSGTEKSGNQVVTQADIHGDKSEVQLYLQTNKDEYKSARLIRTPCYQQRVNGDITLADDVIAKSSAIKKKKRPGIASVHFDIERETTGQNFNQNRNIASPRVGAKERSLRQGHFKNLVLRLSLVKKRRSSQDTSANKPSVTASCEYRARTFPPSQTKQLPGVENVNSMTSQCHK